MTPTKYLLTPPEDLHPLTDSEPKIYPDFDPWMHTKEEDRILKEFVAKGFYTTSRVNFETISARSALQGSLPKVSKLLGDELSKIIHIREGEINIIGTFDSPEKSRFTRWAGQDFHLPSRVTLTDQKRNLWLQELSSTNTSMQKLTKSVPHGFRKRHILEQCYIQAVPIRRVIWLIKSCYAIEWKALVSKSKPDYNVDEILTNLYKEWTDNMVFIMEKLVFEMTKYYNDPSQLKQWKLRISYYLKLLGNCYELELLDKVILHQWLIEFLGKVESFEFYPMTLHILAIFWKGIMGASVEDQGSESSFLVIKLSEILLRKYHTISESKCMINDSKYIINDVQRNLRLKEAVSNRLKNFISSIFHLQSLEAFIMPKQNWNIYKNYLYQILLQNASETEAIRIKKKLELISYRNESLRLGSLDVECSREPSPQSSDVTLESIFTGNILNLKNVSPDLLSVLDSGLSSGEWSVFVDQKITRIEQVVEIILWCINPSRQHRYDSCHLVAKILVLKLNSQESFQEYNIEDIIWSLIFHFSKLSKVELRRVVWLPKLHQLLNVFIGYGIAKVPTYIRRLISSGVLYLPESENKNFHCKLLINLKISPVMKSQYNMVLKNVSEYAPHFYEDYNFDKLVSIFESLKPKILDGNFDGLDQYPGSVRVMCSEWYLSQICFSQGELAKTNSEKIIKVFELFCVKLGEIHHFFGWAEFIVYHQLIDDLENLEVFTDILLYLNKGFLLLINDHILFMKTLLNSYMRDLKYKDSVAFEILNFKSFWKFFVKNCSTMIEMDSGLQSQVAEVFEMERSRREKSTKSLNDTLTLYLDMNGIKTSKLEDQNFPSVIQQNLKKLLHSDINESASRSRKNLLLCKIINNTEYNKFLSIFIKRGDFSTNELLKLISWKLVTLEIVQKTSNFDLLCELVSHTCYMYGLNFENEKTNFIRKNFKLITLQLLERPHYRSKLVQILVEYGTDSHLIEKATHVVSQILRTENSMSIVREMLGYGMNIDDNTEESTIGLYRYLNFTNTWLFQLLTEYNVKSASLEQISNFFSQVVTVTGYNSLFPRLFGNITDFDSITKLLKVIEEQFLNNVLSTVKSNINFLHIMMDTAIVLSRKIVKSSGLEIDDNVFQLFKEKLHAFALMSIDELKASDENLNEMLKIVVIHERYILKDCLESIELKNYTLVEDFYHLFEKTGKDLKLKLMLYDFLNSLKSYLLHELNTKTASFTKIPDLLYHLPKFAITSFLDSEENEDDLIDANEPDIGKLGLLDKTEISACREKFFLFNKKTSTFDSRLNIESFQLLISFQEPSGESLNNTCLSLGLFDARLEKTNPS